MESKYIDRIVREIEAEMAYLREPLFTSKRDRRYSPTLWAHLHLGNEWDAYAEGYKRAADVLIGEIATRRGQANFLVFPILSLYRHYLELRLKELALSSAELLKRSTASQPTHNLLELWRAVRPNLETWGVGSETLDAVKQRLEEFSTVDPWSEAARYPQDRKGEPTLQGLSTVNLGRMKAVVKAISNVLDGSSLGIGESIRMRNETMVDYEPESYG